MKKTISILLVICMLAASLSACSVSENESVWASDLNITKVEKVTEFINITDFDAKLLNYFSDNTEGNYMVSPLSFRFALGLLLSGANGQTKEELLSALGVSSVDEWTEYCRLFNGFVARFDEGLARDRESFKEDKKNGYVASGSKEPFRALKVANSIWKREDINSEFKQEYMDYILKNYAAESYSFGKKNAAKLINDWASKKTEKMIDKLLPEEYDASDLAVCLMNALYFKDAWEQSFIKERSYTGDFTDKNGNVVSKEFMHQENRFRYYADEETQLVVLPMKGGLYMAYVLGNTDNLSEKMFKSEPCNVDVKIPKIDMESSFSNGELVGFLKENGVSSAFGGSADFSSMMDYGICVDDIIQKTRIKTDEDGVEAAAVTAIMMKETAMAPSDPVEFNADRPFSFYIYTCANDVTAMLFAGEIVE